MDGKVLFSPNNNTGVVFVGGSCAVLVSITGEIYMQSSAQNAPVWEKRGIHYNDINVTITSDQWITSANGLKYFNYNEWNLPVNTIGYQQIYHLGQGHQEMLHAQFIIILIFSFDVKTL